MKGRRSVWGALAVTAALLLGAAGCNTYSYFEVDVKLDPVTMSNELIGQISRCHVRVSGATTDDFYIKRRCPPTSALNVSNLDMGVFEYATFADAGMITFTLQLFRGASEIDENKLAEGTASFSVDSGKTVMGMLKAVGTGVKP